MRDPLERYTHQDDLFIGAVAAGCTPVYTGVSWECRCPRATHAISTTCAIITFPSLGRFLAEQRWFSEHGDKRAVAR